MRLSLVLWCRCRKRRRQRTPSMTVLACLIALGSPTAAGAQSAANLPRIGLLIWDACEMPGLIDGLRDLGRIPGENIIIECGSAGGEMKAFSQPQSN